MRALVTGGAGFIGSTLVDHLLADGHTVHVVDNLTSGDLSNLSDARSHGARFEFVEIDVRDRSLGSLVATANPQVIFHLAAQASVPASIEDPFADADTNVLGTINLLEAARHAGVRKVCYAASGGTLYGDVAAEHLPVTENRRHQPASPYGISKAAALTYLTAYELLYGLQSVSLALANVYGPRQDSTGEAGVVAIFSADLVAARQPTINGDGEQTRDFVFVDDVVEAFILASTDSTTGVVNISSGSETSVNDLFRLIAAAAGQSMDPRYGPARDGEVRRSALDPALARKRFGWSARTPLTQGVAHVVAAASGRGREGNTV